MKENFKIKSVKSFVAFLALMLIMTFVSRMMYTSKMARVTTATIKSQALSHDLQANGSLEAVKKTPVFVPENLRISDVCVNMGDQVDEGTVILQLDTGYINEKIAALEKEIDSDRKTAGDSFQGSKNMPVFTESGLRVSEVCVKVGDVVNSGQILLYLDPRYLDNKLWDLEDQIDNNICQRDGYAEAEDHHAADAMSNTIEEQQRKYDAYLAVARAGGVVYSNVNGTVTSIISPGAVTEDSAVALISVDDQVNYSLSVKQKTLNQLKTLAEQEGKITSPIKGVVSSVSVAIGGLTSETSAMTISDVSKGFVFCAHINENDTKYISVGDEVSVSFRNGKSILDKCTVKLIIKDENEPTYKVEIPVTDEKYSIGELGTLKTSSLSDKKCEAVPLSAVTLRSDTNGYIYVVEESDGFLGVEHTVRKMDVRVEDKNDNYYGLAELGLDPQTKIVVSSSKKLSDGQRVRA